MDDGTTERIYEFDGVVVDAVRRVVTRDGLPVQLTSKAIDTLLFLLSHRGQTLTKREIMEAVWPDTAVEENNLTQQISAVRRALRETPGDHRFIITVPGRGYSFVGGVAHTSIERSPRNGGYSLIAQLTVGCVVLLCSLMIGLLTIAASSHAPKPKIAVLAFHSTDGSDDSLGAGMRFTLTAKLGTLRDVVDVRPAGLMPESDPLIAGRKLAVDAVVDGTIQHVGEQVRVTVQMVDVSRGRVLWGKSIDTDASRSLAAQDLVADEVVAGLSQLYARS